MLTEGTIIALSTAAGAAAIGVIRLSGPQAISATEQLFRARSKKTLKDQKSHTVHLGDIVDGEQLIDEVLVCHSAFLNHLDIQK